MNKNKKSRFGRVEIVLSYVVDLNDEDMVEHAKDSLVEDVYSMVKNEEIIANIKIVADKKLSKNDIPEFLLET